MQVAQKSGCEGWLTSVAGGAEEREVILRQLFQLEVDRHGVGCRRPLLHARRPRLRRIRVQIQLEIAAGLEEQRHGLVVLLLQLGLAERRTLAILLCFFAIVRQ